jgi:hypothetical protein
MRKELRSGRSLGRGNKYFRGKVILAGGIQQKMVVPQVRKDKIYLQARDGEGGATLLNPSLRRKVDNFVGRFIALRTITRRNDRRVMGVGMKMEKFIKVGVLGTCWPKVNMLVTMLPLGEVVVQHWSKERHEKSIHDNDDDKSMTKHCCRGRIRQLCITLWVHSLALLSGDYPGFPIWSGFKPSALPRRQPCQGLRYCNPALACLSIICSLLRDRYSVALETLRIWHMSQNLMAKPLYETLIVI